MLGIICSKLPYKENHLICSVILSNGTKVSALFYGGRGGGKRYRGLGLELGNVLKLEVKERGGTGSELRPVSSGGDLYVVKSWELHWQHYQIRYDYQAYLVLCFMMECAMKFCMSVEDSFMYEGKEFEGLFVVLSNALYHLDNKGKFNNRVKDHLGVFLGKMLWQLGLGPKIEHCIRCERLLDSQQIAIFSVSQGGFICRGCIGCFTEIPEKGRVKEAFDNGKEISHFECRELIEILYKVKSQKYSVCLKEGIREYFPFGNCFHFICYQLGIVPSSFMTAKNLF